MQSFVVSKFKTGNIKQISSEQQIMQNVVHSSRYLSYSFGKYLKLMSALQYVVPASCISVQTMPCNFYTKRRTRAHTYVRMKLSCDWASYVSRSVEQNWTSTRSSRASFEFRCRRWNFCQLIFLNHNLLPVELKNSGKLNWPTLGHGHFFFFF